MKILHVDPSFQGPAPWQVEAEGIEKGCHRPLSLCLAHKSLFFGVRYGQSMLHCLTVLTLLLHLVVRLALRLLFRLIPTTLF